MYLALLYKDTIHWKSANDIGCLAPAAPLTSLSVVTVVKYIKKKDNGNSEYLRYFVVKRIDYLILRENMKINTKYPTIIYF